MSRIIADGGSILSVVKIFEWKIIWHKHHGMDTKVDLC